jgi:GNAT superfamily N-acetyltransferase
MPNERHLTENLPPDYPSSYESVVQLADGRQVEIRPILPSDAPELAEAIRTADAETLYARFLGGPPQLTDAVLNELTRLDYVTRFALVARSGGRGVAVARYGMLPASEDERLVADVAVAVAPEWRRVGLATTLVGLLARRAQECGITDFTALFLASNRPVTELAHEGHSRVVIAKGVAQLHAALSQWDQDRPGDDRPDDGRHQ